MEQQHSIYTAATQCQDCYKCVRACLVKAIRIEKNHASILPELCVLCGHCVEVCPAQAKRVRDDIGRVRLLLANPGPVVASIAPSWVCEFPGVSAASLIAAIKQLGFHGVSETSLGAQAVSAEISQMLRQAPNGLFISSACPVTVEWIRKYQPRLIPCITRTLSPLLAHCKLLQQALGPATKVVFFGPCIAKKLESDNRNDLLALALTFQDLRRLLEQAKITLEESPSGHHEAPWLIEPGGSGRFYPAEGGMLRTLHGVENAELLCVSGIRNIQADIEGIEDIAQARPVFLEALSCSGGCINGPAMTCKVGGGLVRKLKIFSQPAESKTTEALAGLDLNETYRRDYLTSPTFDEHRIAAALHQVDKHSSSDELNCGGCGYDTCREFAQAMLLNKAEPEMCVSFMRKQAQKKANALLRSIPSGVVIVDKALKIVECNRSFAEMFDDDTQATYEGLGGLEDVPLSRVVPFADLFQLTLQSGKDICRENYLVGQRVLNLTIFSIQPGEIAGAVIQDVTEVQWRRQQIARNAREVLRRNLTIVQEIAHKLGEHMADNEILLNSIAYSYSDETEEDNP
ncbi:MAG TPA: [Fe-Fe] hydrogenase large subunit C-terminal domain-containing protein [Sedimentisphaerales bacterium]|nr:[Fe-Fe] hydrogenase large subunit C-terminal domain-containing protein [Sedimentisphaerales bacterium]